MNTTKPAMQPTVYPGISTADASAVIDLSALSNHRRYIPVVVDPQLSWRYPRTSAPWLPLMPLVREIGDQVDEAAALAGVSPLSVFWATTRMLEPEDLSAVGSDQIHWGPLVVVLIGTREQCDAALATAEQVVALLPSGVSR
jgi:hypothetical protein